MAKKILLVEDDRDSARLLQFKLESLGYEVALARDGLEGIDKARQIHPDLIILDVVMPRMDGFTVSRLLRYDDDLADVPIVFLTCCSRESDIVQGFEAGGDVYLSKPVDLIELARGVRQLIGPPEEEQEKAARAPQPTPPTP